MKHIYEITFRTDLGSLVPEIGEIISEINETYKNMTSDNSKLVLMSGPIVMKMTTKKKLTEDEMLTIKGLLVDEAKANSKNIVLDSMTYKGTE